MTNKMLIDATHPEETRVVVLRGNRVEEFDFEAADRQQLRGNIYLAKVTRVEPSLQAAFVDYGGNRHGFLAFSEIHPDYYQIPYADRQALIQEQAREEAERAAEEQAEDDEAEAAQAARDTSGPAAAGDGAEPERREGGPDGADSDEQGGGGEGNGPALAESFAQPADASVSSMAPEPAEAGAEPGGVETAAADSNGGPDEPAGAEPIQAEHDDTVETVGAEDALEEVPERRKPRPRQYKIQEVIKRRQVMLVQVVKEERGTKGAALTTYLSLAGRYSVLMPNTGRGGGISRKITNQTDRKRLKAIASELDVPDGMGVILRTAGANRTKAEVKRDFEYLLRLWENVRELTLRSSAPKLVYEEGSLIKRSIRDLYSREIEQVVVAGEDAYREAKEFMRMLMPSHARNVQLYRDDTPIFSRNGVEAQLDAMFSPQVTLKSGGYIVINQTEALVSIDVNSGRSTREHSIEDTALNTNLEAAEEIARQLRLRDLAGLIVIDFIDMEEKRNNRSVERRMKDCLRADRARIQVGRISHFGLLEMSRQRLRTGVLESSTVMCPHCRGTGQVRSIASLSLQLLRALEDHLLRHGTHHLHVRTRPEAALYVLNQKRHHLAQLEDRFGLTITVSAEPPENGAGFTVERGAPVEERPPRPEVAAAPPMLDRDDGFEEDEDEGDREMAEAGEDAAGDGRSRRSRRRRRRPNGSERHDRPSPGGVEAAEGGEDSEGEAENDDDRVEAEADEAEADERPEASAAETRREDGGDARRRRRGRRGGRRRGRSREGEPGSPDRPGGNGDDSYAEDMAFAPGDPSEAEAAGDGDTTQASADWDDTAESQGEARPDPADSFGRPTQIDNGDVGIPNALEPARFDDPGEPGEPAPLPAAAAEQVTGIFGGEAPTGDAHADEVEALEAAAQREHGPDSGRPADGGAHAGADTMTNGAAADGATAAERQPEPVAPAPAPVEDNRPKRTGWWSRRF